jgi:RNA-directed DNA polymerase
MRKGRSEQKNEVSRQLELFRWRAGELLPDPTGGTGERMISRAELLSQLEEQRTSTEHLMERIVDYGNLTKSFKRVSENDGSPGVDAMDTDGLRNWLGNNLFSLQTDLLSGEYKVSPVMKVEIQKPFGGTRVLGIPTVKDRLIQQAIHQELTRWYDPLFSESSYGFRPGRNAHQAILKASEYVKSGQEWVVDIDLEKFFDKINHDRLMQRLYKGIGDKGLLRLIKSYLQAGLMVGGLEEQRKAGTPQGGPLSPLLSNIVLDELDKELESRGHNFCRYADDCNIFVGSKKAGERVMASMVEFIEKKLKLKVNSEKSGVRHCSNVKFLGYTVMSGGRIRVADASVIKLKDKIRKITKRSRGVSFNRVIRELNASFKGWSSYFKLADSWLTMFRELDGWIRRRLRCYRLKQCGRSKAIVKLLRSLGTPENKCWGVALYSHGWWNMSNRVAVGHAMNNKWFALLGLQSLNVLMNP